MNINLALAIYGIVTLSVGFILGYNKYFVLILIELIFVLGVWIYFYFKDERQTK